MTEVHSKCKVSLSDRMQTWAMQVARMKKVVGLSKWAVHRRYLLQLRSRFSKWIYLLKLWISILHRSYDSIKRGTEWIMQMTALDDLKSTPNAKSLSQTGCRLGRCTSLGWTRMQDLTLTSSMISIELHGARDHHIIHIIKYEYLNIAVHPGLPLVRSTVLDGYNQTCSPLASSPSFL